MSHLSFYSRDSVYIVFPRWLNGRQVQAYSKPSNEWWWGRQRRCVWLGLGGLVVLMS